MKKKNEGYHLLVLSAVYRLLYFLYTEGIRSEEDTETAHGTLRDLERMKLCMEFVREHYGERISLADAAGLLAITPEHFCRLFAQIYRTDLPGLCKSDPHGAFPHRSSGDR